MKKGMRKGYDCSFCEFDPRFRIKSRGRIPDNPKRMESPLLGLERFSWFVLILPDMQLLNSTKTPGLVFALTLTRWKFSSPLVSHTEQNKSVWKSLHTLRIYVTKLLTSFTSETWALETRCQVSVECSSCELHNIIKVVKHVKVISTVGFTKMTSNRARALLH